MKSVSRWTAPTSDSPNWHQSLCFDSCSCYQRISDPCIVLAKHSRTCVISVCIMLPYTGSCEKCPRIETTRLSWQTSSVCVILGRILRRIPTRYNIIFWLTWLKSIELNFKSAKFWCRPVMDNRNVISLKISNKLSMSSIWNKKWCYGDAMRCYGLL